MSKVITAKFDSKCRACNCMIPAGTKVLWAQGVGVRHETNSECSAAMAQRAAEKASQPKISTGLEPIVEFINRAKEHLKAPKIRVLAPDARTEMRISVTTKGQDPGSIAVVLGQDFAGCVRTDGRITGRLAADQTLQQHLMNVAHDPARAAKEYAALMGLCSFCGKQLTDDGSVEVGYGPICAKHYNLPHRALGVRTLIEVPDLETYKPENAVAYNGKPGSGSLKMIGGK